MLLAFVATVAYSGAHARGIIQGAPIQKITTSGSSAYLINTGVDSVAVSGETKPACATNAKSMTISTADKANLALLLTAYASGLNVKLVGKDECNEVGSVESIGFIQVVQ